MRTLILPPASLFLLAAIGWLIHFWWPRAGRAIAVAALGTLVVLCTGYGARTLVRPLERMNAPLAATAGTGAQAIVVLSAGRVADAPEYGGEDIPDMLALTRLRYAARLHRETGLPILVSGGNVSPRPDVTPQAEAMARALRDDFRTPVRWLESTSKDTAENAQHSARILRQDGIGRILLVTDAMHMPRAQRAFAANGLEVVPAPTHFLGESHGASRLLIPNAESLRRSQYAIHEWIGMAWYRVRYGF